MPTCRLPTMTIAPNAIIATATPISTPGGDGPVPPWKVVSLILCLFRVACARASRRRNKSPAGLRRSGSVGGGEEACFLHQVAVTGFFLLDPFGVFGAGHEGLVERAVLHQLLPLRRFTHLLEQIDVERDLVGRRARRQIGRAH